MDKIIYIRVKKLQQRLAEIQYFPILAENGISGIRQIVTFPIED
jgi:hypothetical protein